MKPRFLLAFVCTAIAAALTLNALSALIAGEQVNGQATEQADGVRSVQSDDSSVEATATLSPLTPQLSDSVTMTLFVRYDPARSVTLPDFGEKYGPFRVEQVVSSPAAISDNLETRSMSVTLAPTRAGEFTLPPIPIQISKGENRSTLLLPASSVTILSDTDPQTASLDRLTGPRPERPKPLGWFVLAALIAAALVWLLRRYKKAASEQAKSQCVLSPSERARSEIDALMKSKIHLTDVRAFYLKLTGIVRRFIEETTGLRAPERTTEEFLREAEHASDHFDADARCRLAAFLEFADLVKFAKFHPTEADIFDGAAKAREFVREKEPPLSEAEMNAAEHLNSRRKGEST